MAFQLGDTVVVQGLRTFEFKVCKIDQIIVVGDNQKYISEGEILLESRIFTPDVAVKRLAAALHDIETQLGNC